jgi:hypothetical protein
MPPSPEPRRALDDALRALPTERAPVDLLPDVLAAVDTTAAARRAVGPLPHWPAAVRCAFLLAGGTAVTAACATAWTLAPALPSPDLSSLRAALQPWLPGTAALTVAALAAGALYLTVAGAIAGLLHLTRDSLHTPRS